MFYLGIDIQKKQSVYYLGDDEGHKVESGRVDTSTEAFALLAKRSARDEGVEVCIESGNLSFLLARAMMREHADVFVVHAYDNALIAQSTKKTDGLDARCLSEQRRLRMLPPHRVYVPSEQAEWLRLLLSHRASLVKDQTRLSNRASRIAERFGLYPTRSSYRNRPAWARLQEATKASPVASMQALQLSRSAEVVRQALCDARRQIELHVRTHFSKEERLLRTMPGVGLITAAALISQVERIERFRSARQLCRYLGLTPVVRESGNKSCGKGICKQGNRRLRGYFTQAALSFLKNAPQDDPVRAWYENLRKRKGWKKARVALARKLVSVAFGVWKHQSAYDPGKAQGRRK